MAEQFTKYLAIHVGHTRVKIGLFDVDHRATVFNCLKTYSTDIEEEFPWKRIESSTGDCANVISIITGSNRIKSEELLLNWNSRFREPLFLNQNSSIPIKSLVDVPEKVGADRLLNTAAVHKLKRIDSPAIIVDSGTAITVDAVSKEGEFLGGAILPGVLMGARAMHDFTTTLPFIDGQKYLETPPTAIGKNTEDAMASGLYWGHLGAVKELVERIQNELGGNSQIFLTGGATPLLQPFLPEAKVEPYLSLIGSIITAKAMLPASTTK